MSTNSSANSSVLHPLPFFSACFYTRDSNIIFSTFTISSLLLLLPLSVIILSLGYQRRQRQRSASSSHSDIITYHMVVIEVICVFGSVFYCISVYFKLRKVAMVTANVFIISACVQMSFHILTCVERYLAVVHPVTYMHLRQGSGVTIRNVSIGFVWLLGCAELSVTIVNTIETLISVYVMQQALSLVIISFCSVSVLRVLKRPGPREGGGDRARVDQSKQRAFYTITAIMGTLLLRFSGTLVCTAVYISPQLSNSDRCLVIDSSYWFSLPSSLVLPLLFLHRAGKLGCCRQAATSSSEK